MFAVRRHLFGLLKFAVEGETAIAATLAVYWIGEGSHGVFFERGGRLDEYKFEECCTVGKWWYVRRPTYV